MKQKLTIFLVLIVFLFASPASAFAATLSLSPSTSTVNKNCTFTIDILLDTQNQDTDGTDVILTYDTAKFSVSPSSIINGKIYSDYPGNSVTGGKISISGIAPASQPYKGSGTFATLNVQVLSTAAGSGTFKFDFDPADKTKTTDTNVVQGGADPVDILTQVTDGTYTIGTGTTCGGGSSGSGTSGSGTSGGSGAAGSKTLPAGGASGAVGGSGSLSAGGPATDSGVIYKNLPVGGLESYTWLIAGGGILLTILGAVGLALL